MDARTISPDAVAATLRQGAAVVVDAACPVYDEDELLATVGLCRALNATVAVQLPSPSNMTPIEDVLEEMCPGLVARGTADVPRVAALLARRTDVDRSSRFEFVTVSPRGGELLAILGDGRSVLIDRPAGKQDDGAEVVAIALAEDALSATLELESGKVLELSAARVAPKEMGKNSDSTNGVPIDGVKLGARLRALRLEAGLTQAELARRTGIHRPNIARVEAGRHTPSLETLARLASAIGVPTTRVLSED
jgi:DNA-binding XRE family transcriptional regulator